MMKDIAMKIEGLVNSFGSNDSKVTVIDGADLVLYKGEFAALVAPSGAGKTTLLMMLGCVLEPTEGKIIIGNEVVYDDKWLIKDDRKLRREKIGFIFQSHCLIPFLNIEENVQLLPYKNGESSDVVALRINEIMTYLDIQDKMKNMPSQLSGGQNQRVAIARALANNPSIILADEPTGALDKVRTQSVVDILKNITRDKNVSIIMVTHDENILPHCDKVFTIKDKKIETTYN